MGLLASLKSLLKSKVDLDRRFERMREATSGTMSSFYMARDRETDQVVGLKILDNDKLNLAEARFKGLNKPGEGEIATSIDHPNVVKTLDYGLSTSGQRFVVMEFLEGQGLNHLLIAQDPIMEGRRVKLIRQGAEALAAVHKAGYIHRDICPRNFMVSRDGEIMKLIDFGLTVPATPPYMQPGNRTGTPNYMAPEVVRRRKTDQRLDIFSYGVTAFELCTFELPWSRGTTGQAAMSHDSEPTDIREYRPNIHPKLAEAIMKCLKANPEDRPASMDQFLRMISEVEHEDQG